MIELVIDSAGRAGLFNGCFGNEVIVRSRQPFLDGARVLLARGHDPATAYNMRHAHSPTLSFVTTTLGRAAGLSVVDAATGTRFRKFVASEDTDEPIGEAAE
jgi:hypothetical protein